MAGTMIAGWEAENGLSPRTGGMKAPWYYERAGSAPPSCLAAEGTKAVTGDRKWAAAARLR